MGERNEVPRYQAIRAQIFNEISSGKLNVGDLIPSETALMKQYQSSRTTVRKAIETLSKEGIIVRKRGIGSVVGKKVISTNVCLSGSFGDLLDVAQHTAVKVIKFEYVNASSEYNNYLDVTDNSQILRIDRVRYKDSAPFLYSVNFIPNAIGQFLTKIDLQESSLIELIPRKCGIQLDKATQEFNATIADSWTADLLEVPIGFPLLEINRVVFGKNNAPVYNFQGYFRSDMYEFTTEFSL